jgi:hypothetical protein
MAHELITRYSQLVLAKLRAILVLKDGVVFNTNYEGDPSAGVVKIPVRDTEVTVSDYDKANGIAPTKGSTEYTNLVIDKDKAVNEIIDGYEADAVPDNIVATRLDDAAYALANAIEADGAACLKDAATKKYAGVEATKDNIYDIIVDARSSMNAAKIPNDGRRYLLATPDCVAHILKSPQFTAASSLGDEIKQTGAIGKIAGFLVIEWTDTTEGLLFIVGHPEFASRCSEFVVPVHLQDLSGSGKYIGASAVQGRNVYGHKVTRSIAIQAFYNGAEA